MAPPLTLEEQTFLDDPLAIEACLSCGIEPHELHTQTLSLSSHGHDIASMAEHAEKRRQMKWKLVREEHARLQRRQPAMASSASAGGLDTALSLAGQEALVLEMSRYGDQPVSASLGGAFHSRRLTLKSSQVGQVPPARRARWSYRRRMETALSLLRDDALDLLLEAPVPIDDAPRVLPEIFSGHRRVLAQPIVHNHEETVSRDAATS